MTNKTIALAATALILSATFALAEEGTSDATGAAEGGNQDAAVEAPVSGAIGVERIGERLDGRDERQGR